MCRRDVNFPCVGYGILVWLTVYRWMMVEDSTRHANVLTCQPFTFLVINTNPDGVCYVCGVWLFVDKTRMDDVAVVKRL